MVSLGQKIKLLKTCKKRLYNHIIVVLCKKRIEKTANIGEIRGFGKLAKMASRQRQIKTCLCKMVTLGQKIKLLKTCEKRLYNHIIVVLCKKRIEKTANIGEIRGFGKLAKMATRQRL